MGNDAININSEIHASLRRLEDADYISDQIQTKNLQTLADQVNVKIKELQGEVYQLHSYMEPHIHNDDLCLFNTLYVGNLQVSSGGEISGLVQFNNNVSIEAELSVDGVLNAYTSVVTPSVKVTSGGSTYSFTPRTITVNGTQLSGRILATRNMTITTT